MQSSIPGKVRAVRERVRVGAVIDGYRVDECTHKGGTGSIYRVTAPADKDPGFPIVMKVPLLGRGESSTSIDSFEMEQIILPSLSGSHVPRFVEAGDLTATPYIVMEWIEGQSLSEITGRAPLPADEVARIGAALADALQSVHEQEVIHLDVKPENFIVRPSGEAVLLDFGFARHARYPDLLAEEQQFAAGSAAYVSPEQMLEDRSDPRSDLFALGVVLYELATGKLPFGWPETLAGMRDRLWREPAPPRAVNDASPAVAAGDHPALPGARRRGSLSVGGAHRARPATPRAGRLVGARRTNNRSGVSGTGGAVVARSTQATGSPQNGTEPGGGTDCDHGRGRHRAS